MSLQKYTAAVTVEIPPSSLDKLRKEFHEVHYHPTGDIPTDVVPRVEFWLTPNKCLPSSVKSVEDASSLRLIQLVSAGAEKALGTDQIKAYAKKPGNVVLGTAAGLHVISIPNYVVAMVINIFNQIPRQIEVGRSTKRWHDASEVDQTGAPVFFNRKTRGRTAGLLGYGALGRESARLLKALGMNIIAANTSGKATPQTGFTPPDTGDPDGSIPSEYYRSSDPQSMEAFLKQCDVLVCSLPNTKHTAGSLDRAKLGMLRPDAVFINVGRGNLIANNELAAALDNPDLLGAAIDVTDPEPLPDNHPLWSHPKLYITPHLSGDAEDELGVAAELFIINATRIAEGKKPHNAVDFERGY